MQSRLSEWKWNLLQSSLNTFICLSEEDCEYWIQEFIEHEEPTITADQRLALSSSIQTQVDSNRNLNASHMWKKLLSYLEPGNRYFVTTSDLRTQECFTHNHAWVPLEKYKTDLTMEWMVIPEQIESIHQVSTLN